MSDRAADIEKVLSEATPPPWGPYELNYPFYVRVRKPAPSMSKHDADPTYWRMEDGLLVARAHDDLRWCLDEVYRLREALKQAEIGMLAVRSALLCGYEGLPAYVYLEAVTGARFNVDIALAKLQGAVHHEAVEEKPES